MNSIVQELIKIEKSAERLAKESADKQRAMEAEFMRRKEQLKIERDDALDKRVKDYADSVENETDIRLAEISSDAQIHFSDMEVFFEQSRSEWENEIFNRIIGQ